MVHVINGATSHGNIVTLFGGAHVHKPLAMVNQALARHPRLVDIAGLYRGRSDLLCQTG